MREEISIVLSKDGWNEFVNLTNQLPVDGRQSILFLLQDADKIERTDEDDYLIYFSSINPFASNVQNMIDVIAKVDEHEKYIISLPSNGDSYEDGNYIDNPFNTYVVRHINTYDVGCPVEIWDCGFKDDDIDSQKQIVSAPVCAAIVNDYVCPACSNDKCSLTEKSCWKCGHVF